MSILSNTIKTDAFVLSRPRITEKATALSSAKNPVYTFEIPATVTKNEIRKAVEVKYKVKPVKINIVNLHRKAVIVRGRRGEKSAVKKALVFLAPGEKIELV